jgi:hypothetical protein
MSAIFLRERGSSGRARANWTKFWPLVWRLRVLASSTQPKVSMASALRSAISRLWPAVVSTRSLANLANVSVVVFR